MKMRRRIERDTLSANMNSGSATTRGATGVASIIMRACVSSLTAPPRSNDCPAQNYAARLKAPARTGTFRRAGLGPMERDVPWSIATVRFRLARGIARKLPLCPCWGKPHVRGANVNNTVTIRCWGMGRITQRTSRGCDTRNLASSAIAID